MKKFPPRRIVYRNGSNFLALCAPEVSQVGLIAEAINDSKESLKRFMPWSHDTHNTDTQLERMARIIPAYWSMTDLSFTGIGKDGDFVCGVGLHGRVPLNPKGREIGYWVRQKYQGQGLATLATKILIVFALDELESDRIQISHNAQNDASRRVIEKVGFIKEGLSRNLEAARTDSLLSGGLEPCRNNITYALLPEDCIQLPWLEEIRQCIEYERV